MKNLVIFAIVLVFLIGIISQNNAEALQQVAGPVIIDVSPGESKTAPWKLFLDESEPITVEISTLGEGSEFLSFPETVEMLPGKAAVVQITASIPEDHPVDVSFRPAVYATKVGEKIGGGTVINIQMKKYVTLNIVPEKPPYVFSETAAQEPGGQTQDGGGGCLIATATYGSELSQQVQLLREIRDNALLSTKSGTTFMTGFNEFYYSFSPTIADWERENPAFREAVKLGITPLILSLSILNYVDMDSEAKVLAYGIGIIMMNIGMYFVVPVVVIHKIKTQKF